MKIILPQDIREEIPYLVWDWMVELIAVMYGRVDPVTGDVEITHIFEAENMHPEPENYIAFYKSQWKEIKAREKELNARLVSIVHTHPIGAIAGPSPEDIHLCNLPANAIYHMESETLIWYNKKGEIAREKLALPPLAKLFSWLKL
jgi:proteasome lid subunit RPN8/RPN11